MRLFLILVCLSLLSSNQMDQILSSLVLVSTQVLHLLMDRLALHLWQKFINQSHYKLPFVNIYILQNPQSAVNVSLVLDGGSQHSYITNQAKEVLGLVPEHDCQLAIAVFGSKQEVPHSHVILSTLEWKLRMVQILNSNRYSCLWHSFCSTIFSQCRNIQPKYLNLFQQTLLMVILQSKVIYLFRPILETDYCKKNHCGESGPVAICMRLVWVLSGLTTVDD